MNDRERLKEKGRGLRRMKVWEGKRRRERWRRKAEGSKTKLKWARGGRREGGGGGGLGSEGVGGRGRRINADY